MEAQKIEAAAQRDDKMKRFDKTYWGVIAGLILPVIGFFVYYFIKTRNADVDIETYIGMALNSHSDYQQDILITCMIPNMFMFYLTNFQWKIYDATKGLVAITLLMGAALFIFTF